MIATREDDDDNDGDGTMGDKVDDDGATGDGATGYDDDDASHGNRVVVGIGGNDGGD